jgi:hypothetical protein
VGRPVPVKFSGRGVALDSIPQILWTQKQDLGTAARASLAATYDAARGRLMLFDGIVTEREGDIGHLVNDTWEPECSCQHRA